MMRTMSSTESTSETATTKSTTIVGANRNIAGPENSQPMNIVVQYAFRASNRPREKGSSLIPGSYEGCGRESGKAISFSSVLLGFKRVVWSIAGVPDSGSSEH